MKKNLVIVRAGDQSLHPHWLDKNTTRNWDLVVSYYGDEAKPYADQYDHLHRFKGSKWQGLHDFCQNNVAMLEQYDYIWLPDDDLLTTCENINQFFDHCQSHALTLAQPALLISSFISHHVTLQRFFCEYRRTNFVEIMAPCFNQSFFQLVKHTFGINSSGWGLEWLWKDMAEKNDMDRFGIIDTTPIYHSRPVSIGKNGGATSEPEREQEALYKAFGLKFVQMRSLNFYPKRLGLTWLISNLHFLFVRVIYYSYKDKTKTQR